MMKPDPLPCSISGCWRNRGEKNRSIPGGMRCWLGCSVRCERMYTTLGLTCSATAANASLSSCKGRAAGIDGAGTGAMADACRPCSCAEPRLGRSSSPANSSPSANAKATKPPNLSQFNDRADIEQSFEKRVGDKVGPAPGHFNSTKMCAVVFRGQRKSFQKDRKGTCPEACPLRC